MNATTIIIAMTVDGDHGDSQHLGERVARMLDRGWDVTPALPRRVAQDIRIHRRDERAIGNILNRASLDE